MENLDLNEIEKIIRKKEVDKDQLRGINKKLLDRRQEIYLELKDFSSVDAIRTDQKIGAIKKINSILERIVRRVSEK